MYLFEYWIIPSCFFVGTYLLASHIFLLFDIYQPSWYKSREISSRPKVTIQLYTKVMSKTMLNFLISFIIGAFLWTLRINQKPEIPSLFTALFQFIICYLFAELAFWTTHFVAHHPILYKKVHALHHAFPRPIAIVSLYCSQWEMVIVNLPLAILMPIILQMHPLLNTLWNCALAFLIVMKHCGHHIVPKWFLDSEHHDEHHLHSKGNYGSPVLDNFFLGEKKNQEKNSASKKILTKNILKNFHLKF